LSADYADVETESPRWPLRTAPSMHALRAPAFQAGRPAVVSTSANAFAAHRPPWACMTASICELEAPYCLDVNRKGYLSSYALPRLRMNHQPLAIATGFHTLNLTPYTSAQRPGSAHETGCHCERSAAIFLCFCVIRSSLKDTARPSAATNFVSRKKSKMPRVAQKTQNSGFLDQHAAAKAA